MVYNVKSSSVENRSNRCECEKCAAEEFVNHWP